MSKIQFWKQFTTNNRLQVYAHSLYSICQRYNFESNLQLPHHNRYTQKCCIRYVKDTILKAIYNFGFTCKFCDNAVFDMSKIQFWKQFTTTKLPASIFLTLYSICQRYNFESNLQPQQDSSGRVIGCIRYVKDTILKAIYNWTLFAHARPRAVFDMSKIQY